MLSTPDRSRTVVDRYISLYHAPSAYGKYANAGKLDVSILIAARTALNAEPFVLWRELVSVYLQYLFLYEHQVCYKKAGLPKLPGKFTIFFKIHPEPLMVVSRLLSFTQLLCMIRPTFCTVTCVTLEVAWPGAILWPDIT